MIFTKPTQLRDAAKSLAVKAILPTTLDSAEIGQLGSEVTQLATISSNVYQASFLERVAGAVESLVSPTKNEQGVTKGFNRASARTDLKQALKEIGYVPPAGEAGRITDLSSDQRLNLILDFNADSARGYGQWKRWVKPQSVAVSPAFELFRLEDRIEPRPWAEIWPEAAAAVDPDAFEVYKESGRMVARKDSPIWMAISDFGRPSPPFKFNSGMWIKNVPVNEAKGLGLDVEGVKPTEAGFADQFKMSVSDLKGEVLDKIEASLPNGFEISGGVLQKAA